MTTKQFLKELLGELTLEEAFNFFELEPETALMALDEIGLIDLERMIEYYSNEDSE